MSYIKVFIGIFVALAASRFVPHPPNFTSLIALSFYVPVLLGSRFLFALLFSFVITDYIIGFHSTMFFTWGSVVLISLISKYFNKNILTRLSGALCGAIIFYIFTNFGVWLLGSYGYSLNGLFSSYILAIPFFGYTLISTLIFSALIETVYHLCIKIKKA
jgi:hypothetical protein